MKNRTLCKRVLRGLTAFSVVSVVLAFASEAHAQKGGGRTMTKPRPPEERRNTAATYKPWTGNQHAGTLAKPLASYSAKEFLDQLEPATWFGWTRDRACRNPNECASAQDSASLTIQAIVDAHRIRVNRNAPQSGYGIVIGRLFNDGGLRDSTTEIEGNQNYPDVYYYVVKNDGRDSATLMVAVVSRDQSTGALYSTMRVETKMRGIFGCTNHPGNRRFPLGDFATCTMNEPKDTLKGPDLLASVASTGHGSGMAARALLSTADATGWFSCGEGCCSAQAPPYTLVRAVEALHLAAARRAAARSAPKRR